MGACGSTAEDRYSPSHDESESDKPPRKTMTPSELRSSRARDSMHFNNRGRKQDGGGEDEEDMSPVNNKRKVSRDSMVYNNRTNTNKTLELALVTAEEFISGCRDVLRSPVLLDKVRELVDGGFAPYDGVDLMCVSMIPRDSMFKFYAQDCLRHSFFATCGGPADVAGPGAEDAFEAQRVPAAKVLVLLRNMLFLKRMQLCFEEDDFAPEGVSKDAFRLACTQPESLFSNGDGGALFDRVAADAGASADGKVDWRHLVAAIADNFINSVALPSVE